MMQILSRGLDPTISPYLLHIKNRTTQTEIDISTQAHIMVRNNHTLYISPLSGIRGREKISKEQSENQRISEEIDQHTQTEIAQPTEERERWA